MAAGPIGPGWAHASWVDTAWESDSWSASVPVTHAKRKGGGPPPKGWHVIRLPEPPAPRTLEHPAVIPIAMGGSATVAAIALQRRIVTATGRIAFAGAAAVTAVSVQVRQITAASAPLRFAGQATITTRTPFRTNRNRANALILALEQLDDLDSAA